MLAFSPKIFKKECCKPVDKPHFVWYNEHNRTRHASSQCATRRGFFCSEGFFMYNYPKPYLSESELIQKLIDSGMAIPSLSEAEEALSTIGYYRLRGYCYHLYNYSTNRYIEGTNFSDILKLYRFDTELSHLLFSYLSQIEIALRVRFVHAFQPMQDVLVLNDPSIFKDKEWYWKNQSTIAGEIARSDDVFILHNYKQYDGAIPLWATVEILSFGMLSKLIKNLKTGSDSAFSRVAQFYKYTNQRGNWITPSQDILTSWIRATSVLRNICAHNSRIYNRSINTYPQLIEADRIEQPKFNGLYQILLAMKYLRPTDSSWTDFAASLHILLQKYEGVYELQRMNFPIDWAVHFQV